MNIHSRYIKLAFSTLFIISLSVLVFAGYPQWYKDYSAGLEAKNNGQWQDAANFFKNAISQKNVDKKKTKVGTMSVEYLPHRELGICLYHLNDMEGAREHLKTSLREAPTSEARIYLEKISRGGTTKKEQYKKEIPIDGTTSPVKPTVTATTPPSTPSAQDVTLIGNRLSIAILPFESRNISGELAKMDLLDKLITWFKETNRFDVVERSQLEKVLKEQQLGLSGVIDASTAVKVGKTIGVDAVVLGSWTRSQTAVSVDARLVDTETAAVITAKEAISERTTLPRISMMLDRLVKDIAEEFPIVDGLVIRANGSRLTLDIGREKGIRKGTRCYVYREGAPLIHPLTGEKIPEFKIVGEAQVTDVFDKSSKASLINTISADLVPQVMDKVQTK